MLHPANPSVKSLAMQRSDIRLNQISCQSKEEEPLCHFHHHQHRIITTMHSWFYLKGKILNSIVGQEENVEQDDTDAYKNKR